MSQPASNIYRKHHLSGDNWQDQPSSELYDGVPEDYLIVFARLGLVAEPGFLVIPYKHHFFYVKEDLKGVKTLINLRQLNHVREVRGFVRKISELLQYQASFIGCFVDNKTQKRLSDKYGQLPGHSPEMTETYEYGIESRIPFINRMYSFIDARTNRYMTRRTVSSLLKEFGFRVVSMTEINGVTYFYSRKANPAA